MIAENKLGLFPRYLGIAPEVVLDALFEKESDIEQADRNTSFDFYIQVAGANKIFVEVKYTENGFAKAKNDEEHLTKFRNTYLPIVMGKSSFLVSGCQDELLFLTHYQILRNLVHISDTDHVVFLFPSANTVVKKQAIDAKERLLTDAGRTHCSIVFLDEFVSFLEDRCAGSPLDVYYQAFRAKYLPQ
jgi:hypothetical protein